MGDRPTSLSFIVPPHSESFGLGQKLSTRSYLDRLVAYARAAERVGVVGAFVYDFPAAMDPWLVAYDLLACSPTLQPVVAVRPHQEAAESVARRVADLEYRFGRPTHVNIVAGATRTSRAADTDKVAARRRLAEFTGELRAELDRLRYAAGECAPLLVTPSSSTPGVVPADCVLMMARPRATLAEDVARVRAEQGVDRVAMLVGAVVRETEEQAWAATARMYAPDRRQEVAGRMFMSQVVSSEHTASYALAEAREIHDERLWYGAPMRGIDAPKLVGSVAQVSDWLRSCLDIGITDVIIDLPPDPAEFGHIGDVFVAGS
ncbi:alkanesulfonate monooxygenase [Micromonospora sonchi]|uniref:Alkanesulfonate monooxygenase n=1 Tax=Micromonospora sonchi TaxID=1763543 RepID=A0A917WVS2_9ACTN|nr:LLM class flavin-dependent oxidoreductase [Micromonospora sonchi]GGM34105.1 alkanesulfonate monooxygenase [Micromonospora sonchi]